MIPFLIFAALLLTLPVLGLSPRVAKGRAFNGAFVLRMPAAPTYGARWRSVLAQEYAEWWAAWAGALLIAAGPALLIAWALPFGWALGPLLTIGAWNWRKTRWGRRQLEYIGWAAEWVHGRKHAPALFDDLEDYARRMTGGYAVFLGISPETAAACRWRAC